MSRSCAGSVRGIITYAGSFASNVSFHAVLASISGAVSDRTGTAQMVMSTDGATALVFLGFSGSGSAISSGLNGPMPSLASTAVAPSLWVFPGQPLAFYVVSLSSLGHANAAALRDGLLYIEVTLSIGALRGSLLPFSFGEWDHDVAMTPDATLSWSVVGNFVLFKAVLRKVAW